MSNKERLIYVAKILGLIMWAIVACITSASVWNAVAGDTPDAFCCAVAAVNIIVTLFFAFRFGKKLHNEKPSKKQ